MLVMVGPDVPDELARKLGERFYVVRSTGMVEADASVERLFHGMEKNGVAVLVTSKEDVHQKKREIDEFNAKSGDPGPALPFEVIRWGGKETPDELLKKLDAIARKRGEEERLVDRLSVERRRERGYHPGD